jgi:hypothetical protein
MSRTWSSVAARFTEGTLEELDIRFEEEVFVDRVWD